MDFSLLFLGFLIGFRHSFDPDHVLAVSQLIDQNKTLRRIVGLATAWALGHSFILITFTLSIVLAQLKVPVELFMFSEAFVGLVLILMGAYSIYQIWRHHIHVHTHEHDGLGRHTHIHIHSETPVTTGHQHNHKGRLKLFLVGALHGLAGSGAIMGLSLLTGPLSGMQLTMRIVYFSLGTVLGMICFALFYTRLLQKAQKWHPSVQGTITAAVSTLTVAYGAYLLTSSLAA